MNFRIGIVHEAAKILDRLDRPTERRIRDRLEHLAVDPFDSRLSAPLVGRPGIRKSRIGVWRILFTVDVEARLVHILTVDTRGQVYKHF